MRKRFSSQVLQEVCLQIRPKMFSRGFGVEQSLHSKTLQIFRQHLLLVNFFLNHMHLLVCIRPSVHYMDILCFFIVKMLKQNMRSR